jgi:hypothetical protein
MVFRRLGRERLQFGAVKVAKQGQALEEFAAVYPGRSHE